MDSISGQALFVSSLKRGLLQMEDFAHEGFEEGTFKADPFLEDLWCV